jgi:O-antigen ligase
MAGLVVLGIFYWAQKKGLNQDKSKIPYYLLTLCFWILLPSYFYSSNTNYWMQKIQIAIPFLLLPLAFIKIPALSRIRYLQVLAFFVGGTFLISCYAFLNYLANQSVINQMYLESKVMPTLVSHHPTFSIMIAFAIYLSYFFYQEQSTILFKKEKIVWFSMGTFLFIFIHVFSVRSGLLSLYILLFIEILKLIFQKKQLKLALYIGIALLAVGAGTMYLSPTVSNKIKNTSQDLKAMNQGESANNQSLSSRIISYQNAIEINKESSVLWGCGLGDVEDENNKIFAKKYPDVSKAIIPHNQFLYYFAAIGAIGLSLFLIGFYGPFLLNKAFTKPILFTHLILSSLYFLVESPLVTQIGVAYVLTFLLLGLQQNKSRKSANI